MLCYHNYIKNRFSYCFKNIQSGFWFLKFYCLFIKWFYWPFLLIKCKTVGNRINKFYREPISIDHKNTKKSVIRHYVTKFSIIVFYRGTQEKYFERYDAAKTETQVIWLIGFIPEKAYAVFVLSENKSLIGRTFFVLLRGIQISTESTNEKRIKLTDNRSPKNTSM